MADPRYETRASEISDNMGDVLAAIRRLIAEDPDGQHDRSAPHARPDQINGEIGHADLREVTNNAGAAPSVPSQPFGAPPKRFADFERERLSQERLVLDPDSRVEPSASEREELPAFLRSESHSSKLEPLYHTAPTPVKTRPTVQPATSFAAVNRSTDSLPSAQGRDGNTSLDASSAQWTAIQSSRFSFGPSWCDAPPFRMDAARPVNASIPVVDEPPSVAGTVAVDTVAFPAPQSSDETSIRREEPSLVPHPDPDVLPLTEVSRMAPNGTALRNMIRELMKDELRGDLGEFLEYEITRIVRGRLMGFEHARKAG